MYTVYLFTLGGGSGGELNQREGKRGNISQSWVENTLNVRGVLGNKCAGHHNLKTVKIREIM